MPGFEHFADAAGAHHLAELHRRNVGLHVVHPAAHRRIEREIGDLDQHLAFVRRAHWLFGVAPVGALRQADRTGCKAELMIRVCSRLRSPFSSARAPSAYGVS
jgi:hypothetical protein